MSLQGLPNSLRNFRSLDMAPTLRSPLLLLLPYLLAGHLPRMQFERLALPSPGPSCQGHG